jgi:hypothetical protein
MGSGSFNAQNELHSIENVQGSMKQDSNEKLLPEKSNPDGGHNNMDYTYEEYEDYEEVDPNFEVVGSIQPDEDEYHVQDELQPNNEKEVKKKHLPPHSNDPHAETFVGKAQVLPDDSLVYRPRRRNIVLVTKSSAYIIWKNAVMESGTLKPKSKKNYWLRVLKKLGEEIDISELPMIRHEQEQSTIASLLVDNSSVVIDEDDSYVWVICGARSASIVENFDIESAVELTSFLFDDDTHIWLRGFHEHDRILNGIENPLLVVDWILTLVENGSDRSEENKEFAVSRANLRHVFGFEAQGGEGEEMVENAIKRLCYDVSGCKLEARLQNRQPTDTQSQLSMTPRFEWSRSHFLESAKKVKFFKRLKKKQKRAGRNESETYEKSSISKSEDRIPPSDIEVHPPFSEHLQHMNQPTTEYEDDGDSLGSADLFDAPSEPPPAKPLLAAAKKAAAARASSQANDKTGSQTGTRSGSHLDNINQPKAVSEDDNDYIGPDELFNEPKGPPPAKPLLTAAKKAAAAREKQQIQARAAAEKEKEQLRLTAAAVKERQSLMATKTSPSPAAEEGTKGTHLNDMNQPKTDYEDDDQGITDLFDEPKGPPPAKPLLTAAKKAATAREKQQIAARAAAEKGKKQRGSQTTSVESKQEQMVTKATPSRSVENGTIGTHLNDMNQPKTDYEDDDESVGMDNLSDEPKGPPPQKPLHVRAAAQKAAAMNAQNETEAQQASAAKAQNETEARSNQSSRSNDRKQLRSRRQARKEGKESEKVVTEKQVGSVPQVRKENEETGEVRTGALAKKSSPRRRSNVFNASMDLGDVFNSPETPSKVQSSARSNEDRRGLVKISLDQIIDGDNQTKGKLPPAPKDEPGQPTTPTSILREGKIGREKRVRRKAPRSNAKQSSANNSNEGSLTLSGVFGVEELGAPNKKEPRKATANKLPGRPESKKVPTKPAISAASERKGMTANLVRKNSIDHMKKANPDPPKKTP